MDGRGTNVREAIKTVYHRIEIPRTVVGHRIIIIIIVCRIIQTYADISLVCKVDELCHHLVP